MADLQDLPTPSLLLERERIVRNCQRMREKAQRSGVILRPHVKTHKTVEGARAQCAGTGPITVSTLAEAEHFAEHGFEDITYAVPLAPDKLPRALALTRRLREFHILVDHAETFRRLEDAACLERLRPRTLLKVDCGYHRAGVDPDDPESLELALQMAQSEHVDFRGLLTHAGHSYHASSREEIAHIAAEESEVLNSFREMIGRDDLMRSVGSTPTMSIADEFRDCDEIRPGNYIFYDAYQSDLGSCSLDDAALSVLASVIGIYAEQKKVIVNAGTLALAREPGYRGRGLAVVCDENLVTLPYELRSTSQEHGQLFFTGSASAWREELHHLHMGRRFRLIANHSCITAAMHDRFHVVENGRVVEEWRPVRGW